MIQTENNEPSIIAEETTMSKQELLDQVSFLVEILDERQLDQFCVFCEEQSRACSGEGGYAAHLTLREVLRDSAAMLRAIATEAVEFGNHELLDQADCIDEVLRRQDGD